MPLPLPLALALPGQGGLGQLARLGKGRGAPHHCRCLGSSQEASQEALRSRSHFWGKEGEAVEEEEVGGLGAGVEEAGAGGWPSEVAALFRVAVSLHARNYASI